MSKRKRKSEAPTARTEKAVASGLPRSTAIVAPSAEQPLARWEWWFLAGVTLFALVLRLWRVGMPSLWMDEIGSVNFAARPWSEMLKPIDVFPPLHLILLRITMDLFGRQEWAIRLSPVLFGTATIPVQYLLTRLLFGRRPAAIASIMLSLSLFHIYYSRDAHGYAVFGLFAALSWLFFCRILWREGSGIGSWIGYALSTYGLLMTNYIGILPCGMQGLMLVGVTAARWRAREKWGVAARVWGGLAIAGLLVAAGMLPYLGHFLQVGAGSSGFEPVKMRLDARNFYWMLSFQGFGNGWGAWLFGGLLLAGLVLGLWRHPGQSALTLTWFLLPYVLFALAVVHHEFHARRIIFTFTGLIILAALGLEAVVRAGEKASKGRAWGTGGAAALVAAGWLIAIFPAYGAFYAMTGHDLPRKEIAAWLSRNLPDGTIIVFDNYYELRWVGPGYYKVPNKEFAYMFIPGQGDYEQLRVRERLMAFFSKYPEAAFICMGQGGPWHWPGTFFWQRHDFVNRGGLALMD
ncbi:MAG: hypothetical protein FJ272_17490, partial [Planctomycetes bacterium]|nr:hypothetical protein [Planctomycetota bacterium]